MNKRMSKEALHVELALAMRKEQDEYHNWLMSQDVATVIAHAEECSVREDILLSMEYLDFDERTMEELLQSGKPLAVMCEMFLRGNDEEKNSIEAQVCAFIDAMAARIYGMMAAC